MLSEHGSLLRLAFLLAILVALAAAPVAQAETFADPSGDNCGLYPGPMGPMELCDADVTSVTQDEPAPGAIRYVVSYGTPPTFGLSEHLPRFVLYTGASTDRADGDFGVYPNPGGPPFTYGVYTLGNLNLRVTKVADAAATQGTLSFTVQFPASAIGSPGQYRWYMNGGNIGELPQEGAELVPNSGFFTNTLGGGGGGGSGGGPGSGDPSASNLALSPSAFPAAPSGASIAARPRRTGTTVRYRLSANARVRFTVEKQTAGRRVGRRCVTPTRANRRRPRCTRSVALRGSFTHPGSAGQNSFRFTGRLNRRKLRPGPYRLVATPLDAGGRRGGATRTSFRIVP